MEPLLLTVPEAAKMLHLSRAVVYELIRSGELPSLKIGAARRVRRDELVKFVERVSAA